MEVEYLIQNEYVPEDLYQTTETENVIGIHTRKHSSRVLVVATINGIEKFR